MHLVLTLKEFTMKKLVVLSISVFFVLVFFQLPAQVVNKDVIKTEIKGAKKEIKTERKELRKLEGGSAVSNQTKSAFFADFGNVPDVKWKRAVYLDEAVFTKDGKELKAYYDFYSKLVGTTSIKTFADIPLNAQKEIKSKYKDYTIGVVVFFDDNEANETDMLLWNTQFSDADNYFVELSKDKKNIVLQVNVEGEVFFFKEL
jgi:hypothetical protein